MVKLLFVVLFTLIFVPLALSGGYTTGKQTGSCYFVPSSTVEGNYVTVYASGLPTDRSVGLFILNYESVTRNYSNLAVNPDGTYSGQYLINADKWTEFQFVSPNDKSSTRLSQNDATCKIWADSAP